MKRLFNSFLLLSKIATPELFEKNHNKEILFALLCMQSKYEKVYDYLISQKDKVTHIQLNAWKDSIEEDIYKLVGTEKDECEMFRKFMESFVDVIDSNDNKQIDENEMQQFKEVLSFSAITSNNSTNMVSSENEYRWIHKEKAKKMIDILKRDFPELNITDWCTRTHDKGSWWVYAKNPFVTSKGLEYACELRLDPIKGSGEMKSSMTISIYHRGGKKHRIQEVLEEIGQNPFKFTEVVPEITDDYSRISYNNVCEFVTSSDDKDQQMVDLYTQALNILKGMK